MGNLTFYCGLNCLLYISKQIYKFPWVVYSYEFLLKYPELVPCHFYDGIDNLCELAKLLIINSYLPLAYRS